MESKLIKQSKAQKKRLNRAVLNEQLSLVGMCSVPAIFILVFSYLPMVGLLIGFKDYRYDKGIFGSEWSGLENFKFLLESGNLSRMLRNTIGLNVLFIVLGLVAAVAVAIMMFELTSKLRIKTYQTLLLLPYFISWVIAGYMLYAMLNPSYGVMNQVLKKFGMEGIDWYSRPEYWPFILSFASVWKGVGMGCIMYYASLMGLDTAYFEAAAIDGATKWQTIKHITIPSLIPLMTIQTILNIGHIMKADFGLFYQLSRDSGALYEVTDVIDTFIYRTLKEQNNLSLSAATSFFQSFVSCALVLATNYVVTKIEPDNALF